MIGRILPPEVATAEASEDPAGASLFPEESAVIDRAFEKRRREFATVRHCARLAMAELGLAPRPVLPGERGAPRWPEGIVGSMTHCPGYRAAALARSSDIASVGIDAEPHEPLPEGLFERITTPAERSALGELARDRPAVHWDRLVFTAKESVYKTWFPLTARWLDWEDAELTFEPETHDFHAALSVSGPSADARFPRAFTGRWLITETHVLSAIAVPHRPDTPSARS
ncbi:4'-phosphopantetheinyl transferase family protein [Streptomyces sp. bgisy091]|uniref:4'-phosphopantetheinyl transferase family protein n=1 Tax=Streptomyces sp. bgisy091 TaxID=3413778 RepID=UPI003D73E250